MFLIILNPVLAGETCNMDVIRLENYVKLIEEQAQVIADYNTTIQALNKTITEHSKALKDRKGNMKAMNKTIQEQGEEYRLSTEALNKTIQDMEEEMKTIKDDLEILTQEEGKFNFQGKYNVTYSKHSFPPESLFPQSRCFF